MKSSVNFEKRPIPSGPAAKLITVKGQKCMKGSSPMTSKVPTENLVPGAKK